MLLCILISDEGDGLSEYDSKENDEDFLPSDEEQVDVVTLMQMDLRGRLVRRPKYSGTDIEASQIFETMHEFRCIMRVCNSKGFVMDRKKMKVLGSLLVK